MEYTEGHFGNAKFWADMLMSNIFAYFCPTSTFAIPNTKLNSKPYSKNLTFLAIANTADVSSDPSQECYAIHEIIQKHFITQNFVIVKLYHSDTSFQRHLSTAALNYMPLNHTYRVCMSNISLLIRTTIQTKNSQFLHPLFSFPSPCAPKIRRRRRQLIS